MISDYCILFPASPNDDHSSASASSSESSGHHRHEAKEDPEVIKQWKEAQIIKLEAKDREEEKAKQVLKQQAKKELEDWYKQHSEQVTVRGFFNTTHASFWERAGVAPKRSDPLDKSSPIHKTFFMSSHESFKNSAIHILYKAFLKIYPR